MNVKAKFCESFQILKTGGPILQNTNSVKVIAIYY